MKKVLLIFLTVAILAASIVPVFANSGKDVFDDIDGHWAQSIINYMVETGIIKQNGQTKFHPNKHMTRMEFAVLLHEVLDINLRYIKAPDITEFFSDVKKNDPSADKLYDLATLGIIDDEGKFRPDDFITREEMTHYVVNAYRYKSGGAENVIYNTFNSEKKTFADENKISDKYLASVKEGVNLGLIQGKDNNKFMPHDKTKRAEAVVVLYRLHKLLGNEAENNEDVDVDVFYEFDSGKFIMKLVIKNNGKEDIRIEHGSSQKFDFKLLDKNNEILYTWSADKLFMMMITETVVKAGEKAEFTADIDADEYKDVLAKAKYLEAYIVGFSEDFEISKNGYKVEIKNPGKQGKVEVKADYETKGNQFIMKLSIDNDSGKDIVIGHGGQKYDFELLDANKKVLYRWSDGKMFIMIYKETTIENGTELIYKVKLDTSEYKTILKDAKYLKAYITGFSEDFDINEDGYIVNIK